MENQYGVREDSMRAIMDAVYMLENAYLNPFNSDAQDGKEEPITLENAINYCYEAYEQEITQVSGHTKAARFSGKKAVQEAIKQEILKSDCIILK